MDASQFTFEALKAKRPNINELEYLRVFQYQVNNEPKSGRLNHYAAIGLIRIRVNFLRSIAWGHGYDLRVAREVTKYMRDSILNRVYKLFEPLGPLIRTESAQQTFAATVIGYLYSRYSRVLADEIIRGFFKQTYFPFKISLATALACRGSEPISVSTTRVTIKEKKKKKRQIYKTRYNITAKDGHELSAWSLDDVERMYCQYVFGSDIRLVRNQPRTRRIWPVVNNVGAQLIGEFAQQWQLTLPEAQKILSTAPDNTDVLRVIGSNELWTIVHGFQMRHSQFKMSKADFLDQMIGHLKLPSYLDDSAKIAAGERLVGWYVVSGNRTLPLITEKLTTIKRTFKKQPSLQNPAHTVKTTITSNDVPAASQNSWTDVKKTSSPLVSSSKNHGSQTSAIPVHAPKSSIAQNDSAKETVYDDNQAKLQVVNSKATGTNTTSIPESESHQPEGKETPTSRHDSVSGTDLSRLNVSDPTKTLSGQEKQDEPSVRLASTIQMRLSKLFGIVQNDSTRAESILLHSGEMFEELMVTLAKLGEIQSSDWILPGVSLQEIPSIAPLARSLNGRHGVHLLCASNLSNQTPTQRLDNNTLINSLRAFITEGVDIYTFERNLPNEAMIRIHYEGVWLYVMLMGSVVPLQEMPSRVAHIVVAGELSATSKYYKEDFRKYYAEVTSFEIPSFPKEKTVSPVAKSPLVSINHDKHKQSGIKVDNTSSNGTKPAQKSSHVHPQKQKALPETRRSRKEKFMRHVAQLDDLELKNRLQAWLYYNPDDVQHGLVLTQTKEKYFALEFEKRKIVILDSFEPGNSYFVFYDRPMREVVKHVRPMRTKTQIYNYSGMLVRGYHSTEPIRDRVRRIFNRQV